jgi:hypothetical protein
MQAYCTGVDPNLNEETLPELATRLDLPSGWTFTSRVLDKELEVDTTEHVAAILQDEFENTYAWVH